MELMKAKKLVVASVIILLASGVYAEDAELRVFAPKVKKDATRVIKSSGTKKSPKASSELDSAVLKLNQQGQKIESLLGKFQERSGVWDFTNQYDFKTGTVIKGVLLNSVVSTNLESPLLVEVLDGEALPSGTRFSCKGVTKLKRVMSACNKLSTPNDSEEFEVQVSLLNVDGSSGLKADEVYTGKEEYVAGAVATAFSKGLIELSTERLASPLGELAINNRKNRLANGVLNSLDETNELMNSEMKTKEAKAVILAGRPVLIYFHERFRK
ncbi:MAG: hypothetical protein Q7U04_06030 [Bacteriovorax sp.]|nr:hypothetical protein [Bacteriovorax sp.]